MPSPTSPGLPSRCSRCDGAEDRRRKAIYEELHPETKHGGNAGGPSGQFVHTAKADFASATADATGKDERTIRRAAARGEALGDDLGAVVDGSVIRFRHTGEGYPLFQ